MTYGQIALALAVIGVVQILLVVVYWHATQGMPHKIPHVYALFAIGGTLTLFGAVCFAIAFMLGA